MVVFEVLMVMVFYSDFVLVFFFGYINSEGGGFQTK